MHRVGVWRALARESVEVVGRGTRALAAGNRALEHAPVFVYLHVYVYVHVHVYMCMFMHMNMNVYMYMYKYVHVDAQMYM